MKFKIAILAFTSLAFAATNVNAQSKNNDQNFPVCKTEKGYKVCDKEAKQASIDRTVYSTTANAETKEEPCTVVHHQKIVLVGTSAKENPRIRVTYNNPGDVYEGDEVLSNDGVDKMIERNLNYLDFSVNRPPNDGGIAVK